MKVHKFQKTFYITITLLLVCLCCFMNTTYVKATEKVDFSLSCESAKSSKLFDVDLIAKGSAIVSALNVTVTYDTNYVAFRSVSSPDDGFEIKKKTTSGKVTSILLCAYGYSFKNNAKLISFKFKSLGIGTTNFELKVSGVTDNKGNKIPLGSVYNAKVTIDKNGVSSGNTYSNSITQSNSIVKPSTSSKVPKVKYAVENDVIGTTTTKPVEVAVDDSGDFTLFAMGILVTLAIVFIVYLAYKIGKGSNEKESDENKVNKDNNE